MTTTVLKMNVSVSINGQHIFTERHFDDFKDEELVERILHPEVGHSNQEPLLNLTVTVSVKDKKPVSETPMFAYRIIPENEFEENESPGSGVHPDVKMPEWVPL